MLSKKVVNEWFVLFQLVVDQGYEPFFSLWFVSEVCISCKKESIPGAFWCLGCFRAFKELVESDEWDAQEYLNIITREV